MISYDLKNKSTKNDNAIKSCIRSIVDNDDDIWEGLSSTCIIKTDKKPKNIKKHLIDSKSIKNTDKLLIVKLHNSAGRGDGDWSQGFNFSDQSWLKNNFR